MNDPYCPGLFLRITENQLERQKLESIGSGDFGGGWGGGLRWRQMAALVFLADHGSA